LCSFCRSRFWQGLWGDACSAVLSWQCSCHFEVFGSRT
jgi:hypothetical protein